MDFPYFSFLEDNNITGEYHNILCNTATAK